VAATTVCILSTAPVAPVPTPAVSVVDSSRKRPANGLPADQPKPAKALRRSIAVPIVSSNFIPILYRVPAVLRIRDPALFYPLDPGFGMNFCRILDLGSRIPDLFD
jgi:hypothetical protein